MTNRPQQTEPCPSCGKTKGWWSKLTRNSMVFFAPSGEKLEHRLYAASCKHCANCDYDITNCVTE